MLARVTAVGVAFLAVDLVVRRALPVGRRRPVTFASAWPVYASVLCAAVLLTAAYKQGGAWMAAIALAPLLLTRFAFDRYAAAEQTYEQTIRALSIVPEVAGMTPFGHGERSAAYAAMLGRKLGLVDESVDRVVTAARLHHIGYVALGVGIRLLDPLGENIGSDTARVHVVGHQHRGQGCGIGGGIDPDDLDFVGSFVNRPPECGKLRGRDYRDWDGRLGTAARLNPAFPAFQKSWLVLSGYTRPCTQ